MKPTILLIDDQPSIHHLAWSYFLDQPWHLCSAYSGVEGLDMAAEQCPDLVLLDVNLPDINGFDVCRHLGAQAKTSRAAVIFLTASASIDEKVCGLQLGALDYVTKPFDPAELTERVRNALRIKQRLDSLSDLAAHRAVNGRATGLISSLHIGEGRRAA